MELDDIKKNKLQRAKDRELSNAKLRSKIKFYAIALVIAFLLLRSDLYDITTLTQDEQTIFQICIDRDTLKDGFECKQSFNYVRLD